MGLDAVVFLDEGATVEGEAREVALIGAVADDAVVEGVAEIVAFANDLHLSDLKGIEVDDVVEVFDGHAVHEDEGGVVEEHLVGLIGLEVDAEIAVSVTDTGFFCVFAHDLFHGLEAGVVVEHEAFVGAAVECGGIFRGCESCIVLAKVGAICVLGLGGDGVLKQGGLGCWDRGACCVCLDWCC